jgi:predicted branched-subunit amino acid permease
MVDCLAMVNLESMIGCAFQQSVGDPIVIGILFVGFFGAFLLLQNTRLDGKVAILFPIAIMAGIFYGFFPMLGALAAGYLLWLAIQKIQNR